MKDIKRWKGLRALIGDAVEHGATAIERVHVATAQRPFGIMEQIPGIAEPVKGIHQIHDTIVTNTYGAVRMVNRALGEAIDAALDAAHVPNDDPNPEPAEQPESQPDNDEPGDSRT